MAKAAWSSTIGMEDFAESRKGSFPGNEAKQVEIVHSHML